MQARDFPGGSEVETLHTQCKGPRFDSWSGSYILPATTRTQCSQKKKKKKLSGKRSNNSKDNKSVVKTLGFVSMVKISLEPFLELFYRI